MPRPARRVPPQGRETTQPGAAETPTRRTATNAITADIPAHMLETPPHAPFVTTSVPPSNNPGQSIVPERNAPRRNVRAQQQTPTANGHAPEPSHSSVAVASIASETGVEEQSFLEAAHQEAEDAKALIGLRDISSLATWTLSSAKPGCALPQLRNPSPHLFWQSDGPQPHTLTLHFFKLVAIVKMRIYLDFEFDESYTPTKMKFFAGMSEGGLVEFGSWEVNEVVDQESGEKRAEMESVRGWIDVELKGVGGREKRYHEIVEEDGDMDVDGEEEGPGDVLKAMVVQVRIMENHQNGKDTHVRGFQVFARDESSVKEVRKKVKKVKGGRKSKGVDGEGEEVVGLQPADWMGDPEIR
jgi:hypothetical protein